LPKLRRPALLRPERLFGRDKLNRDVLDKGLQPLHDRLRRQRRRAMVRKSGGSRGSGDLRELRLLPKYIASV
jgi:hypothetical protein